MMLNIAQSIILIVDDHAIVREGLETILEKFFPAFTIAQASNATESIDFCARQKPAIVLMDINMPGLDGVTAIGKILRHEPNIKIIVLTALTSETRAADAFKAGAQGYLLKGSMPEQLAEAIRTVLANRIFIDASLDRTQLCLLSTPERVFDRNALTLRQQQVLKLIAEGHRNRQIAEMLCVSVKTVESHRLSLMQKLEAHNAADLTRWAVRLGYCEGGEV